MTSAMPTQQVMECEEVLVIKDYTPSATEEISTITNRNLLQPLR